MSLRIVLLLVIINISLTAQSKYPADSLLTSDSLNLAQKAGVLPIAAWQRLSYNLPGLGCQFYPSCSNYGAQAIHQHGLLAGAVVTADRIVRCNPAAWDQHLHSGGRFHEPDGRLVDPVVPAPADSNTAVKSPLLAATLSTFLPGSGRAYAGRPWDGFFGFLTVAATASVAHSALHLDRPIEAGIFLSLAAVFYAGEIYGAWRAARYFRPRLQIPSVEVLESIDVNGKY
ncbi:MAG: membrane protein insertion efficiency factor YidD [Candidatus Neomarinimicrobiota bacterium]